MLIGILLCTSLLRMLKMTKRIMIVDDEPDVQLFLTTLLEDHGFETITTEGRPILDVARETVPDLICMDVVMPRQSGLSLFLGMKKDPELEHIPVIMLTGLTHGEAFIRDNLKRLDPAAESVAPDCVVEKPIQIDLLLNRIHDLTA